MRVLINGYELKTLDLWDDGRDVSVDFLRKHNAISDEGKLRAFTWVAGKQVFECTHDAYVYWHDVFENQAYLMRHIELFSRVCGSDIVELVLKKASENRTERNLSETIKSDIIALEEAFIRVPNITT
nr:hypothetical protein [uncultured Tolumonas sp.]